MHAAPAVTEESRIRVIGYGAYVRDVFYLARSANLREGLYILLVLISFVFRFLIICIGRKSTYIPSFVVLAIRK